ncbi:discoidin domain-containing protein [Nocardioides sp. zg-1230]|uniref:discoidin domain-containing protein n=1 Tax=Nocardioides sp. zg-1230 TaxID=2736601 RepID=UPI0015544188|nr:discoidin domain-containing protein [Nocardioides sp. zg-1230]NPC43573.1 discoidin domain-containing protein [Nocardioides sp. zg-1230]
MDTCVACGAELGVGRFCLNCGHRIGAPAPVRADPSAASAPPSATMTTTAPALKEASDDPSGPTPDRRPADAVPAESAVDPERDDVTHDDVRDEPAPVATRRTAWDPRQDLLPYEEVDDLDADLPVRGKAWIGWVLGAALLMGLAFVLLRVFDTGDEVATDPASGATSSAEAPPPDSGSSDTGSSGDGSTGDGPSDGEAPAGVGKVRELARGATFEVPGTAPPTTDFDGNLVAYVASQMGDGNPATAWRTAGDATGQTITVTLPEPGVVTRVGLVNGYAKKVAGVDWYPNNRRTVAVTWGFDDGTTVEQTFAERPGMQRLKVPPVETAAVTLTFTAVTPPGAGNLGRDYTAISEVSITGRRAG